MSFLTEVRSELAALELQLLEEQVAASPSQVEAVDKLVVLAFGLARELLAVSPIGLTESRTLALVAGLLPPPQDCWVRWGTYGYVFVTADGQSGRYSSALPPGVAETDVVDPPDVEVLEPREHLAVVGAVLEAMDVPATRAGAAAAAEATCRRAYMASEADFNRRALSRLCSALIHVIEPGGEGTIAGVVSAFSQEVTAAHTNLAADGELVAVARILVDFDEALAEQNDTVTHPGNGYLGRLMLEGLGTGPLAMHGVRPDPFGQLAHAVVLPAISDGHVAAVVRLADRYRENGEQLVADALEATHYGDFYSYLYASAAPFAAAMLLDNLVPSDHELHPQAEKSRNRNDEWLARVLTSLDNAVANVDAGRFETHKARVAAEAAKSHMAGQLAATQLIEDSLMYPRAIRPLLFE